MDTYGNLDCFVTEYVTPLFALVSNYLQIST